LTAEGDGQSQLSLVGVGAAGAAIDRKRHGEFQLARESVFCGHSADTETHLFHRFCRPFLIA
jgi:hypothetical protein